MPLPTSGPLTLADIQTEFGGTNPISLSEYYAGGGLVPSGASGTFGAVPSSGAISIQNFYGTANSETQVVTVGTTFFGDPFGGGFTVVRGFSDRFPVGSISDGTFGFVSNATINELAWFDFGTLYFRLVGTHANSGWTKLTLGGVDYFRSSASFSQPTGFTEWIWASSDPFGADGTTSNAVFTP
jgi:hypothetical protein